MKKIKKIKISNILAEGQLVFPRGINVQLNNNANNVEISVDNFALAPCLIANILTPNFRREEAFKREQKEYSGENKKTCSISVDILEIRLESR